jgi:tripartite-type tricarboxylate transporter receptor subunit TctC
VKKIVLPALAAGILSLNPGFAQDGPYPNRPVRMLVGAPAGGPSDIVGRTVGQKMGSFLGQQVVVENRAGAGATLAAGLVAKSPADGYTLFMTPSAHSLAPSMYTKLPFDPLKDFEAVGTFGIVPVVVMVNKDLPVSSLKELVDLARRTPNSINFGSGGAGSSQHLSGELLMSIANIQMTHVPYKGTSPAMVDLVGGQIQLIIEPIITALPQVQGGKAKALAITGSQRSSAIPDVPTTAEAGYPGLNVTAWYGLLAPAGTPADVIARLNTAVNKTLADPATQATLKAQGVDVTPGEPSKFRDLIASEITRWAPIIKRLGIKAD